MMGIRVALSHDSEPNAGFVLARLAVSFHPLSPTLPTAIVQVEQESVISKFLEGLIVVPVHVACSRATN